MFRHHDCSSQRNCLLAQDGGRLSQKLEQSSWGCASACSGHTLEAANQAASYLNYTSNGCPTKNKEGVVSIDKSSCKMWPIRSSLKFSQLFIFKLSSNLADVSSSSWPVLWFWHFVRKNSVNPECLVLTPRQLAKVTCVFKPQYCQPI
jgi:hypothetical protein